MSASAHCMPPDVMLRADRPASGSQLTAPPATSTTPARTAEFVVPASGYGTLIVTG